MRTACWASPRASPASPSTSATSTAHASRIPRTCPVPISPAAISTRSLVFPLARRARDRCRPPPRRAILGNRHRFCGTSSPSSPDRPLTDPPLPAQLLRRCADPPRVRRLRYRARLRHLLLHLHHHPGTSTLRCAKFFPKFQRRTVSFGVSQNAFLDFPRKTHTQGFPG